MPGPPASQRRNHRTACGVKRRSLLPRKPGRRTTANPRRERARAMQHSDLEHAAPRHRFSQPYGRRRNRDSYACPRCAGGTGHGEPYTKAAAPLLSASTTLARIGRPPLQRTMPYAASTSVDGEHRLDAQPASTLSARHTRCHTTATCGPHRGRLLRAVCARIFSHLHHHGRYDAGQQPRLRAGVVWGGLGARLSVVTALAAVLLPSLAVTRLRRRRAAIRLLPACR